MQYKLDKQQTTSMSISCLQCDCHYFAWIKLSPLVQINENSGLNKLDILYIRVYHNILYIRVYHMVRIIEELLRNNLLQRQNLDSDL